MSTLEEQLHQALTGASIIIIGAPGMSAPSSDNRYTKAESNYQDESELTYHCDDCDHYTEESCRIVSGHIDPCGVCDFYHGVRV